jgi:hypothetical protein
VVDLPDRCRARPDQAAHLAILVDYQQGRCLGDPGLACHFVVEVVQVGVEARRSIRQDGEDTGTGQAVWGDHHIAASTPGGIIGLPVREETRPSPEASAPRGRPL